MVKPAALPSSQAAGGEGIPCPGQSFLLRQTPPGAREAYAMALRLTPEIQEAMVAAHSNGLKSALTFLPGNQAMLSVGGITFSLTSLAEDSGQARCDCFGEEVGGESGGRSEGARRTLRQAGVVKLKLQVRRNLDNAEKSRNKERDLEAQSKAKARKTLVIDAGAVDGSKLKPGAKKAVAKKGTLAGVAGGKGRAAAPPRTARQSPAPASLAAARKHQTMSAAPTPPPPSASIHGSTATKSAAPPPTAPKALSPPASASAPAVGAGVAGHGSVTSGAGSSATVAANGVAMAAHGAATAAIAGNAAAKKPAPAKAPAAAPVTLLELSDNAVLRRAIIDLLRGKPMSSQSMERELKQICKGPPPAKKDIERVLKSVATFQAPALYHLKPEVGAEREKELEREQQQQQQQPQQGTGTGLAAAARAQGASGRAATLSPGHAAFQPSGDKAESAAQQRVARDAEDRLAPGSAHPRHPATPGTGPDASVRGANAAASAGAAAGPGAATNHAALALGGEPGGVAAGVRGSSTLSPNAGIPGSVAHSTVAASASTSIPAFMTVGSMINNPATGSTNIPMPAGVVMERMDTDDDSDSSVTSSSSGGSSDDDDDSDSDVGGGVGGRHHVGKQVVEDGQHGKGGHHHHHVADKKPGDVGKEAPLGEGARDRLGDPGREARVGGPAGPLASQGNIQKDSWLVEVNAKGLEREKERDRERDKGGSVAQRDALAVRSGGQAAGVNPPGGAIAAPPADSRRHSGAESARKDSSGSPPDAATAGIGNAGGRPVGEAGEGVAPGKDQNKKPGVHREQGVASRGAVAANNSAAPAAVAGSSGGPAGVRKANDGPPGAGANKAPAGRAGAEGGQKGAAVVSPPASAGGIPTSAAPNGPPSSLPSAAAVAAAAAAVAMRPARPAGAPAASGVAAPAVTGPPTAGGSAKRKPDAGVPSAGSKRPKSSEVTATTTAGTGTGTASKVAAGDGRLLIDQAALDAPWGESDPSREFFARYEAGRASLPSRISSGAILRQLREEFVQRHAVYQKINSELKKNAELCMQLGDAVAKSKDGEKRAALLAQVKTLWLRRAARIERMEKVFWALDKELRAIKRLAGDFVQRVHDKRK